MKSLLALTLLFASLAQEPAPRVYIDKTSPGQETTFVEQHNPKHGVFEQKSVNERGELLEWIQNFVDEDGKVLVQVIRKAMGHDDVPIREGFQYVIHHTYRADGKRAATVEFLADGRIRHRTVWRYDDKGVLLGGDRYRDGKRVGWVHGSASEPPEASPKSSRNRDGREQQDTPKE